MRVEKSIDVVNTTRAVSSPRNEAVHIPLSMFQWESGMWRLVRRWKYSVSAFWNRASATVRSAHGHWKTEKRTVAYGPALQILQDGLSRPETSTQARIRHIDSLLAIRPWADIVDRQIAVDGFEAGEKWGRCSQGLDSAKYTDVS